MGWNDNGRLRCVGFVGNFVAQDNYDETVYQSSRRTTPRKRTSRDRMERFRLAEFSGWMFAMSGCI
jgi:hypothetical protein